MPPISRRVGPATIIALEDGAGPFFEPRERAFPDATTAHWQAADRRDPAAVTPDGGWWLAFRCFAIRFDDGPTVLVDAGIGPAGSPAAAWAPVPGRLPTELAAAGVAPEDVTAVVLTHLHTDHIGWAVTGAGEPYFRNASYLLQRAEVAAVDAVNPALGASLLAPLRAAGRLYEVAGEHRLNVAARIIPTPGHTPGHQSVLVEDAGETVLLTGDLLVHAVQLVEPALAYAYEVDAAAARASRVTALRELAAHPGRVTLATAHLGEPFTEGN
jgi:glyoxylase-like metal-dependent hydrolase (beta-lactamase superfamily II)